MMFGGFSIYDLFKYYRRGMEHYFLLTHDFSDLESELNILGISITEEDGEQSV